MIKDIIIIGAGPGGYELALAASKRGQKVILIEEGDIGGTCLHHGCIPTKTYYHSAKIIKDSSTFFDYGISGSFNFDFSKAKEKKDSVISELLQGIEFQLKNQNIEIIKGRAKLISQNEVIVNNSVYRSRFIVIATGSKPSILNLPGFMNESVITSTELLEIEEIPKKLVVIGGGVVGVELASIFSYFGSEVTIVEAENRILPMIDMEVSKRLMAYLKSAGINFHLSSSALKIENNQLYINTKDKVEKLSFDKVLVAVGRRPNVENIGLEEIGISFSKAGINVDHNFKTNISNIYAIGDVTGKMMLAHTATYSAYAALSNILGEVSTIDFNLIPNCIFTFPEVASIGLTEREAKPVEYKVNKYLFKANGRAHTSGEIDGFVKIISFENKVLGVHIIGPNASEIIHEAVIIMNSNVSVQSAKNIIFAHPTLSEVFGSCILEI